MDILIFKNKKAAPIEAALTPVYYDLK